MLKYNCRYFSGDRPCEFYKKYKVKCDSCTYYYPIKQKILIIKLDAIGDVLRTTSILPPLKQKYPESHITWCTMSNAKELFDGNNLVDEIVTIEEDAHIRLTAEEFDIVINLDSSKISSAIAAMVKGKEKKGFVLNQNVTDNIRLQVIVVDNDVEKSAEHIFQEYENRENITFEYFVQPEKIHIYLQG
jgi:heptosyltransferase-2